MAIKGLASNEVHEYISRDDPCTSKEDGATVFYSKAIPNVIMTRISDNQSMSQTVFGDIQTQTFLQRSSFRNRECFRFAVNGWDNFFDVDDIPIMHETEVIMEGGRTYHVVADRVMDRIRLTTINEVGNDVWSHNTLTDDQRKNFEALLSASDSLDTSSVETVTTTISGNEDASDQPSDPDTTELTELPKGMAVMPTATSTGKTPARTSGKTGARAGSR
jgi:hypothetical protein